MKVSCFYISYCKQNSAHNSYYDLGVICFTFSGFSGFSGHTDSVFLFIWPKIHSININYIHIGKKLQALLHYKLLLSIIAVLANQIALQCEFDKNQILKSQIPKPNHYHFGFYASEINAQFSCQITKSTYCKTLKKVDILFLQTMQYSCNTVLGELGATMNLSLNSLQDPTNTVAVNVFSSACFFRSHFFFISMLWIE